MKTPVVCALFVVLTSPLEAEERSRDEAARRNCIVVTPQGPRDGGDFGPHTPGTKTSGLQEAFNAAKDRVKDVYLCGGSWTESKTEPVVYFLSETLHIPWMQNFRCDSGNCVLHYSPTTGDAVVLDSQMSCSYRFGLIVSMSCGATVRLKPSTAGPDRFKVITSTDIYFNALVGGGGAWPSGEAYNSTLDRKRKWIGTGLLLDGSEGSIDANRIYVTEVVGCNVGVHLSGSCTHNVIEATTIHLCQNHLQVGDEDETPPRARGNRIVAHMEAQGIPSSFGAKVYGIDNQFSLSSQGMGPNGDLLLGPHAEGNLITAASLVGFTNRALKPTNRIVVTRDILPTMTPPIPPSGKEVLNEHPWPVAARILESGKVARWTELDAQGKAETFDGPLERGQILLLNPGDRMVLEYTQPPRWNWKAIR